MYTRTRNVMLAALLVAGSLMSSAEAQTGAADQAAKLRAQLTEVQAKEAAQQTRLKELEEALKPENIEHSLAGVGSTHPEELREQRRRQLEQERSGVKTQLDQLATSRDALRPPLPPRTRARIKTAPEARKLRLRVRN